MEASITTKYLQAFYWGFVNGMAIDHTAPETNFEVWKREKRKRREREEKEKRKKREKENKQEKERKEK